MNEIHATVLLGVLLRLEDATREGIGAIRIQPGPTGTRAFLYGVSLATPLRSIDLPIATEAVADEVATLRASGLFGGVTAARAEENVWKIRLWSQSTGERETWERRILAAEKDPAAARLLTESARTRRTAWQHQQATARVSQALAAAIESGMPRPRVAELAAITPAHIDALVDGPASTTPIFHLSDPITPAPAEAPLSSSVRQPAPARPAPVRRSPTVAPHQPVQPLPDGVVRLPRGRTAPCHVCGLPAPETIDGGGIHLGQCLATYRDRQQANPAEPPPTPTTPKLAPAPAPPSAPASAAAAEPQRKEKAPTPVRKRFLGPAAAIDGDSLWLPDGQGTQWSAAHLGEVAMLVSQHRLGWGGGEDRHPDEGQIWLYTDALDRLGLPADLGLGPLREDGLPWTQAQWEKAKTEAFTRITELPAVQHAIAEGWQLGQGGRVDVWTRIWHPQLLRSGARLVFLPWNRVQGVSVMADRIEDDDQVVYRDASPADLVARLAEYAQLVGISYRLSPATTGLDLIDRCRPPRRDSDDTIGQNRNRVSVIRNQPAELPAGLLDSRGRFTNVERDYHWSRPWNSLTDSEKACKWVVLYDRGASYLTPWTSISLGVEGLSHHVGDQARWDGKSEAPAFYLVDRWEWTDWWLPDPVEALGAFIGPDKVWVTVHTMRQLAARGIRPTIHEAYTWTTAARYLEQPGNILRQAREQASAHTLPTIKSTYSAAVGKLGENEHSPNNHLWRPDWRQLIIAATRTAIQHTLIQIQETSGAIPLVVDFDLIGFALDEPRWPGPPGKEGTGLGQWKLVAAAPLHEWGPGFLPAKPGRFLYKKAVDAARTAHQPDAVSSPPYGDEGQKETS